MTYEEATQIVEKFGFVARRETNGFFLTAFSKDRWGSRHYGDDHVLVKDDGSIILYIDEAQAFLAAKVLSNVLAPRN